MQFALDAMPWDVGPGWVRAHSCGKEEHALERSTAERMLESSAVVLSIAERGLKRGVLPPTPQITEAVAALRESIERARAQDHVTIDQMAEVTVSATRVTKLIRRVA